MEKAQRQGERKHVSTQAHIFSRRWVQRAHREQDNLEINFAGPWRQRGHTWLPSIWQGGHPGGFLQGLWGGQHCPSLWPWDGAVMAAPRGCPHSPVHSSNSSAGLMLSHYLRQNTVCVLTHTSLMLNIFSLPAVCCYLQYLLAREQLIIQAQPGSGLVLTLDRSAFNSWSLQLLKALQRRTKKGRPYATGASQCYHTMPQRGSWCSITTCPPPLTNRAEKIVFIDKTI